MMDVIAIAGVAVTGAVGAVSGYWRGRSVAWKGWQEDRARLIERRDHLLHEINDKSRRLNWLRRNCFVWNEHKNRVRYWNATPEQRAKAEGLTN